MPHIITDKSVIIVKLSDLHVPYEDKKAGLTAIEFASYLNPKYILIDEWCDWYSISSFLKDPKRKLDFVKDKKKTIIWLDHLRTTCPNAKIIMLASNHDRRIQKYILKQAPELADLEELTLPFQLRLHKFNIKYLEFFRYKNTLYKHGHIVRRFSGYTAKGELDSEGMSGQSGHSHRAAIHYRTLRAGDFVWAETGCLCSKNKFEYLHGKVPDWQHAVGVTCFGERTNRFNMVVPLIINGSILWGDKIISYEEKNG